MYALYRIKYLLRMIFACGSVLPFAVLLYPSPAHAETSGTQAASKSASIENAIPESCITPYRDLANGVVGSIKIYIPYDNSHEAMCIAKSEAALADAIYWAIPQAAYPYKTMIYNIIDDYSAVTALPSGWEPAVAGMAVYKWQVARNWSLGVCIMAGGGSKRFYEMSPTDVDYWNTPFYPSDDVPALRVRQLNFFETFVELSGLGQQPHCNLRGGNS